MKRKENIEQQNKEPQNFEGQKINFLVPTLCGSIFLVEYSIFSFIAALPH